MTAKFAKGEMSGNVIKFLYTFQTIVLEATNDTINHPTFQKMMREETFDAVIHGYTLNSFQLGLAAHFKCPSILLSSVAMNGAFSEMVGQPLHPEAVPSLFLSKYKGKMTFWQRLANMFAVGVEICLSMYQNYMNAKYYENNFPSNKYPAFEEVRKNVSLFLANDHFAQGTVKPNLPNVIEVSGLQMSSKPAPLPNDIKQWVDGAKDGLVFVSFGTNIKSKDLTLEKRHALLNNFAKLKQRVLWKFEDDTMQNLPVNVMIKKWLPQNDILAHKNTKLFISHMGIGGFNEAMYHAVPVIAVPFGGDQAFNAEKAMKQGWAEVLPSSDLTEAKLKTVLEKMFATKKYAEAVQKLSSLFKDKPMTAVDSAIFWIEYVIRHRGAEHMQYPGVDLNFIQSNSLDVFGFLLAVLYILVKVVKFGFRKVRGLCCRTSKAKFVANHQNKKKKRN